MKNLTVKTTNWSMTDEVRSYLDEKLLTIEKLLSDPDADTVRCDVELGQTRDAHADAWRAEINVFISGNSYRAVATSPDGMEAAIDGAKEDMQRQLRKYKRKNLTLIRRGGAQLKKWMRFGRGE